MRAAVAAALAFAAVARPLVLSAALASCGVGGALAGAGGGGGGGGEPTPPPTVRVVDVTSLEPGSGPDAGYVEIDYELRDPLHPFDVTDPFFADIRIQPEFRESPEASWRPMTARFGEFDDPVVIELGRHRFIWNSMVDLPPSSSGFAKVRVRAEYEHPSANRRRFHVETRFVSIDNFSVAGTASGGDVEERASAGLVVGVRPTGESFLVAGSNVIERVDATGAVERVVGSGREAGDPIAAAGANRGVFDLPSLAAMDVDPEGNPFAGARFSDTLLVTNAGASALTLFGRNLEPRTTVEIDSLAPHEPGSQMRAMAIHPSGVLVVADGTFDFLLSGVGEIHAVNPGTSPVSLAGQTIAGGGHALLAGGPGGTTKADGAPASQTAVGNVAAIAVGPDGEIYYADAQRSVIRVINTRSEAIEVGGVTVEAGAVATVAGQLAEIALQGFAGDGGPASSAVFAFGSSGLSGLAVSPERALFVADSGNDRVRLVNLGAAAVTFAETTVAPGAVNTVVGGGSIPVGGRADQILLHQPRAVALDAKGSLLVAVEDRVVLVNGGVGTVNSYGKTAGPSRTALVYDGASRGGFGIAGPRAVHSPSGDRVFFTDRSTVRLLNMGTSPIVVGRSEAAAGEEAAIAGGSVPDFSGDAGPSKSAAFDRASALASDGPSRLFVADTGNDRVRCIDLDAVGVGAAPQVVFGVSIEAGNVDTVAGGATAPVPDDGDGLKPTSATLASPQGLALTATGPAAGLLFVSDTGHHRIRVLNPGPGDVLLAGVPIAAGTIQTLVGDGVAGFTPDGAGPWLVDSPTALAVDDELLYFAETGSARIRVLNLSSAPVKLAGVEVAPSNVLTIVGSGVRGNGGDGGLGPDAQIDAPRSLFVQRRGGTRAVLYFADGPQHVLRALNLTERDDLSGTSAGDFGVSVLPARTVVTVLGGPNAFGQPNPPAYAGDGEAADRVRLSGPFGVAVTGDLDPDGFEYLFFADEGNDRLRHVGAPRLQK